MEKRHQAAIEGPQGAIPGLVASRDGLGWWETTAAKNGEASIHCPVGCRADGLLPADGHTDVSQ